MRVFVPVFPAILSPPPSFLLVVSPPPYFTELREPFFLHGLVSTGPGPVGQGARTPPPPGKVTLGDAATL